MGGVSVATSNISLSEADVRTVLAVRSLLKALRPKRISTGSIENPVGPVVLSNGPENEQGFSLPFLPRSVTDTAGERQQYRRNDTWTHVE